MNEKPPLALRFAQPLRTLAQRSAFLLLLAGAIGLMLLGKTDPQVFDRARTTVTDVTAPILDVLSRPAGTVQDLVAEGRELMAIHAANERLRRENARLMQWQAVARRLEQENAHLRELLNYKRPDAERFVTGRVIGYGGSFVRALLLNVGSERGVRKGQAAVSGEGLVGRVAEVGERSSRVLLVTDLNSRIPVVIQETRVRAILAGDNTKRPRLIYLSANSDLAVGQRVVTSGHGGAFPPGIPVGRVVSVGERGVRVEPVSDTAQLEFVQLMDFGLGGIVDSESAELTPSPPAEAAAADIAETRKAARTEAEMSSGEVPGIAPRPRSGQMDPATGAGAGVVDPATGAGSGTGAGTGTPAAQ